MEWVSVKDKPIPSGKYVMVFIPGKYKYRRGQIVEAKLENDEDLLSAIGVLLLAKDVTHLAKSPKHPKP